MRSDPVCFSWIESGYIFLNRGSDQSQRQPDPACKHCHIHFADTTVRVFRFRLESN